MERYQTMKYHLNKEQEDWKDVHIIHVFFTILHTSLVTMFIY